MEHTLSERNYLLDNLKGMLIFLVVLGHSFELYKSDSLIIHTFYVFIYLFHMPAFIFVSGYFSKNVDKARETAFKNFLLPFIVFNSFWNFLAAVIKQDLRLFSFITPGWALWYLLSMFFWKIFLKDLVRIRWILPLSFIIGLGSGIFNEFDTTLSLSRTLVFLPFFLVGYFTSESQLFNLKKPHPIFSLLIITLATLTSICTSYFNIVPVEFLYGSESFKAHTLPLWLGLIGRSIFYLIGFFFVFALANTLPNKSCFFTRIGQNTFPIYLLHPYLLVLLFVLNHFIPMFWLRIIISIISSIGITYILSTPFVSQYFQIFISKCSHLILCTQITNKK